MDVVFEVLEAERRANDDLIKRCVTLEKKYFVVKVVFVKFLSEKIKENDNVSDKFKCENKELKC